MEHLLEYNIRLTRKLNASLAEEEAQQYAESDKKYIEDTLNRPTTIALSVSQKYFLLDDDAEPVDECEACRIDLDELNAEQQEHNLPMR